MHLELSVVLAVVLCLIWLQEVVLHVNLVSLLSVVVHLLEELVLFLQQVAAGGDVDLRLAARLFYCMLP